ncbi:hypothetical protein LPJ61_006199, partial [Coemansia biformis]
MPDGSVKHRPLAGSAAEADRASLDGGGNEADTSRAGDGRVSEASDSTFGDGESEQRDLERILSAVSLDLDSDSDPINTMRHVRLRDLDR